MYTETATVYMCKYCLEEEKYINDSTEHENECKNICAYSDLHDFCGGIKLGHSMRTIGHKFSPYTKDAILYRKTHPTKKKTTLKDPMIERKITVE